MGKLKSRHRVTSIDSRHGRTIVTVETEAEGMLQSRDGKRPYSGELKHGKIQTQGVQDEGPRAVVGGTGEFRNVRGEATGADLSEFPFFTITFKLIGARNKHHH